MKVWGIGAYFPEKEGDITKECLKENAVVIGFKEEEKPKYYELLPERRISVWRYYN